MPFPARRYGRWACTPARANASRRRCVSCDHSECVFAHAFLSPFFLLLQVVKLRKQFPRIVVKYIEDESGNSLSLALPDPITAYLTMSDVEPGTLVQP